MDWYQESEFKSKLPQKIEVIFKIQEDLFMDKILEPISKDLFIMVVEDFCRLYNLHTLYQRSEYNFMEEVVYLRRFVNDRNSLKNQLESLERQNQYLRGALERTRKARMKFIKSMRAGRALKMDKSKISSLEYVSKFLREAADRVDKAVKPFKGEV